ncbi:MAG: hypothetical protein DWQ51_10545 [Microcystis wesenbergii TW10]|uniref:Uncharacterized protein n=2 Tax=Microcystis TaxID=1125 RepID=A0A552AXU5_MICAE|nr:MAG: hypothetical protein DWQ51_10545 [Microcystis wesenbergii TW10]TRT90283.1 MAG: hypothetical protein EWV63_01635 [Microcystis aeruginosa Ma_OC_H_19870700_S124]
MTKLGFFKGTPRLKLGFASDYFITQSQPLRVSTPQTPLGRTGACYPRAAKSPPIPPCLISTSNLNLRAAYSPSYSL